MKKHLIFLAAFASVGVLAASSAVSLVEHGRSSQFVLVWMTILIIAPLYVISSWISMRIDKEGYIGKTENN